MKCSSCAAEVPAGARFCPACAAVVPLSGTAGVDAPTELAPEGGLGAPPGAATPPSSTSQISSSPALDGSRFAPGTLVGERYRIVGVLGKGGMGEVYRADDLKLGQSVALKFLPPEVARDREWLDRFLNEVKIARQISNPNVCRVYDVGEIDGQHFLSMEYIDGEDLGSLLRRIGRLPEDKAIQIARQLCAGLAAAHDQGVLHRDLKPANVMIDGRGRARLTDFGLAGLADSITEAEISSGTPAYMAPEQLEGREVTVQSDLYALGLVLYELFTGRQAFEAGSAAELSKLQQESAPAALSSVVAGLDPVVERVVLRCLDKDPSARPRSALEVSAALPGGDPLLAALAAGETPSPEMVAAAGEEGTLAPRTAVTLLVATILMMLVFVPLAGRYQVTTQLPLELPPDVLQHKSKEILGTFGDGGGGDVVVDTAWGFAFDFELQTHLQTEWRGESERWDAIRTGRPALLRYWYRQSPRQLIPLRRIPNLVSWTEPPYETSGMAAVRLDTRGRLLELIRVPPQLEDPASATAGPGETDWAALFDAAELDMEAFAPVAPTWVPQTYADERAAWTGPLPGLEDVEVRLEAAAYRGEPVYFQVVGPWTRAARQVSAERSTGSKLNQVILLSVLFLVLLGSMLVARHNIKAGRGDRQGALRVAMVVLVINGVAWLFRTHHVASVAGELILFVFSAGVPLLTAALTWLLYVALEPYLRKHQPHWLVAWSRLLNGQVSDPLVGRDVLIGIAVGATSNILGSAAAEIGFLLEPEKVVPQWTPVELIEGLPSALGWLTASIQGSIFVPLFVVFIWFVFRLVLRSNRIAGGLLVVLFMLINLTGATVSWVMTASVALMALLFVLVTARFGLVALMSGIFCASAMGNLTLTYELSTWWSRGSWACIAVLAVLTVWAFRTALGGRAILAES